MSDDTRSMLTGVLGVLLVIAVGVGVALWLEPAPAPAKPDTVLIRLNAKTDTVRLTTTRSVHDVRTIVDTLPGDTIYIARAVVETLLVRCQQCAEQLERHQRITDSIIRVVRDSLAQCQAQKAAAKRERKWWALAGGAVGIAVCQG